MLPYAINKLIKENKDTESFEFSTVEPTADFRVITVNYKRIGDEKLDENNLRGIFSKYKISIDMLPNIGNFEWYDKDFNLVKEYSSILNIEQITAPKESIYERFEATDLFYQSLIPVDSDVKNLNGANQVTYKIQTSNNNPKELFISDERQRIIQSKNDIAYIKIKDENYKNIQQTYPIVNKGFNKFLKSSLYINSDDEGIKNVANKIAQDQKDALKVALDMEAWVYNNVSDKNFSVNFANAKEVLKSKQGDCTEHSVLLAALLRAAGIPAKVVVGLSYKEEPQSVFAYHMWVKAFVGKWINLDPTKANGGFAPTYIALFESALNEFSDRTDLVLNVIESFSDFKIQVLNYSFDQMPVTKVNLPKKASESEQNELNLIKFLKNNDEFIKKISLKKENKDSEKIVQLNLKKEKYADFVRMGFYNYSKGNIDKSIENFNEASKLVAFNNEFSDVQFATKLASLGLFSLAESKLKDIFNSNIWKDYINDIKMAYYPAIVPNGKDEELFAQAFSLIKFQDKPDDAINLINNNVGYTSDYSEYLLAKAYHLKQENKIALKNIDTAISLNPENISYKKEKVEILMDLKNYKKALKVLENITDTKLYGLTNYKKAEKALLKSKIAKKEEEKNYYLANYFYLNGEYKKASAIIDSQPENKDFYERFCILGGDINTQIKEYNTAEEFYKKALRKNKKSVAAFSGMADLKSKKSDYESALILYTAAQKYSKERNEKVDIFVKVSEICKKLEKDDMAFEFAQKALKEDPENYKSNYISGDVELAFGNIEKASNFYRKALKLNPMHVQSWLGLADIQIKRNNSFLAKIYLKPVNCIDEYNPQYYYYMGIINKKSDDFKEAKKNFEKTLVLDPTHPKASLELKSLSE